MNLTNIKNLCSVEGITFQELEKRVGIGNGVVARWATSYPRVDNLKKVADYFNVTVDTLISDRSTPTFSKERSEGN